MGDLRSSLRLRMTLDRAALGRFNYLQNPFGAAREKSAPGPGGPKKPWGGLALTYIGEEYSIPVKQLAASERRWAIRPVIPSANSGSEWQIK
jgi:hypothetical protein